MVSKELLVRSMLTAVMMIGSMRGSRSRKGG